MPRSIGFQRLRQIYSKITQTPEQERHERSPARLSRRQFLQRSAIAAGTVGASSLGVRPLFAGNPPRFLIVGAGVAGLTIAYRLQQAGIPVDIVDAAPRMGGRLRSLANQAGCPNPVELGGEFIDTCHQAIQSLVKELGLPIADLCSADQDLTPEVFYFGGERLSHDWVVEAFTPLAKKIQQDVAALGGRQPTYRTHSPLATALDRLSLEDYLETVDLDPKLKSLVRVAYITEYGLDSHEQTCLNMLFLIGREPGLWSTYGESDERWHIVGGNEQIVKTLARRVQTPIRLETQLESIRETGDRTYQVSLRQGSTSQERTYDGVILAMPFSVLRNVTLKVDLPPLKREAIAQLGYGTCSKLVVPMRDRLWRNRYHSTMSVYTDLALQNTWESSRYAPGRSGWITNLRGGQGGLELGRDRPDDQAKRLLGDLDSLFPGIQQVQRGRSCRAVWAAEPYALGSYACYRPGQTTRFGGIEAEPVGNLWFAGEHCSIVSQGYINGAVESAEQVASQILTRI
ncbi:FAD-dependent oxidoreductase [Vacuolonema iberomarrocanum]|uniref:FAD-dependent oxidoreductase n=1 Tax=Vacuolonema iberomarrocanum TaxID=3454632 RepID=UPI0019EBDEFF|nr:FAD-dependent oxidoreductase [filamentous cyanobacterium LEGE 07170]